MQKSKSAMRVVKNLFGCTLAVTFGVLLLGAPMVTAAWNYRFNATKDTYAFNLYPITNYGSSQTVEFGNRTYLSQQAVAFLEYDLTPYGVPNVTDIGLDWNSQGWTWSGATNSKYIQYEIIELLVDFDENALTWANNPCGVNFDNATACNITNSFKFNYTLNQAGAGGITFNITAWANETLWRSQKMKFLIKPSFSNDTGFSGGFYSREYTGAKQKMELLFEGNFSVPPSAPTTPEEPITIGTITNDYLEGFAGFLGESLGVDITLGKMFIWVGGEIILIYYLITKSNGYVNGQLGALIFGVLLVVGSLLGFLPIWVAIVFIILAVAIVVMWGQKILGGGE